MSISLGQMFATGQPVHWRVACSVASAWVAANGGRNADPMLDPRILEGVMDDQREMDLFTSGKTANLIAGKCREGEPDLGAQILSVKDETMDHCMWN